MTYTQADLQQALARKGSRLSQDPDGSLHKVCLGCQIRKPVSTFWKSQSTTGLAWSSRCGACINETRKPKPRKPARIPKTPEESKQRARAYEIKKNFGLTMHEYHVLYARLFEEQGGLCAICHRPPRDTTRRMSLDHCHETGRLRGLLCNTCNRNIGRFSDRLDLLESAVAYLKKHS